MFILILSLLLTTFYAILILRFYVAWRCLKTFEPSLIKSDISMTVLVAARNEANTIEFLLKDLVNQRFKNFELIVINDHSQDDTENLVNQWITKYDFITIINLKEADWGKKAAIKAGISAAKFELIVTTDADCRVGEDWLWTIADFYQTFEPQLIIAPVMFEEPIQKPSFLENFQQIEFLSLIASTAAATALNRPIMCNAANLAFEKSVYTDFNSDFVSGDDVFLMLHLKKQKRKILFLKSSLARVYTATQKNLHDFIQQRLRWTSKSRGYKDKDVIITALIVWSLNFLLFALIFVPKYWILFFCIFAFKLLCDGIFLYSFASFFDKKRFLNRLIPMQMLYIFYCVGIGFLGNVLNFKWKGRTFKP